MAQYRARCLSEIAELGCGLIRNRFDVNLPHIVVLYSMLDVICADKRNLSSQLDNMDLSPTHVILFNARYSLQSTDSV